MNKIRHSDAGDAPIGTQALSGVRWRKGVFLSSLIALPATIAVLTGRRSKLMGSVAGGLTALALLGFRYQFQRWFTEEPRYTVDREHDAIEVRTYAPHVEARTRVLVEDHDTAIEQGFRVLARYIFGGNREGHGKGEKLEMTAPVTAQRTGHGHTMAFVMPPGRTLASLPMPDDARIALEEVPARRFAVLTYRGRYDGPTIAAREAELLEKVRAAGLETKGEPMFAGFDPPNTIPWLRRNEVWVELADAS